MIATDSTSQLRTVVHLQQASGSPLSLHKIAINLAQAWQRRSSAYANAGEFQEADDCTTNAADLFRFAEEILP